MNYRKFSCGHYVYDIYDSCPICNIAVVNRTQSGGTMVQLDRGWECPKCGAVMAPSKECCVNCTGKKNEAPKV
jgi:hypothetical protein